MLEIHQRELSPLVDFYIKTPLQERYRTNFVLLGAKIR